MSLALLAVPLAGSLQAQEVGPEGIARHFSDAEIAAVPMPALAFEETAEDVENYEKYFYFHRSDTSFDEAYADIHECDALSDGRASQVGTNGDNAFVQGMVNHYSMMYGLAGGIGGALGGAIGSAMADAIWGSAERRRLKRLSMRNCMHFKGYGRYGLTKDRWAEFNFDEGNGRKPEEEREQALLMQARIASGPAPQRSALES